MKLERDYNALKLTFVISFGRRNGPCVSTDRVILGLSAHNVIKQVFASCSTARRKVLYTERTQKEAEPNT
jgi:hypothetical protein